MEKDERQEKTVVDPLFNERVLEVDDSLDGFVVEDVDIGGFTQDLEELV
jgi:hypothetical protein